MSHIWNWILVILLIRRPDSIILSDFLADCPYCNKKDYKSDMLFDIVTGAYFCDNNTCKELWYTSEYIE